MKARNIFRLFTILFLATTFPLIDSCKKEETENTPPVAAFTGTPTSGLVPLTVNFTDQSASNPTSWQWDFGDGDSSAQQDPLHTYNSEGTYTVELLAGNANGSDTEVKSHYITVTTGGGTGEPCPGIPTVTYEGRVYNTVLIGSQCWLKENLNVGTRINGGFNQNNNGIIEKYCYNNLESNCDIYGGLYQWDEMMQYTATPGTKGICPPGWHIPTDDEWKILEGTVDSLYPVGDPEWEEIGNRGFDAGENLKSSSGWSGGYGTDLFGFTALPGGYRLTTDGSFSNSQYFGTWWSSTEFSSSDAWFRHLAFGTDSVYRYSYTKSDGRSIRCLKD